MIKANKKRTWQKEELINAVKNSTSRRQVLRKLRLKEAGGNYTQIKKYITELKLDTRHFTGQGWNKGLSVPRSPVLRLDQILVQKSTFQSHKLKNRLFKEGIKPKRCEECGWAKISPDDRLPLELEHVNGDSSDNRLENLKILCPNCHSLTLTYRKRKK
jgi:Zn finger protein HypA/HybF involved in hydrogenase expression